MCARPNSRCSLLQRPFRNCFDSFLLPVKMASSSNNLYTVRRHCKDIQRAIQPHLDRVIDECFLKRIISPEAYKQVISCGESVQPDRLFRVIQSSVTRSAKNYDLLLQVLHDILPKECSSDLLPKLNATRLKLEALDDGQVPRSASEPIISPSRPHSRFVTSFSLNCEQAASGGVEPVSDERDKENGGLHFRNIGRSDSNTSLTGRDDEQLVVPVQECADNETIGRERDEFSAAVEETRENGGDPSYLKQRSVRHQGHHNGGPLPQVNEDVPEPPSSGASGIVEAVTRLRHVSLECQQRHAQVNALNREVEDLRGRLTSAHENNEKLALKMQRQSEDIENLRRKEIRQISALRDEARNSERLRTQVAELEVDRHVLREKVRSVTAQYEPRIRDLENARSQLQRRIESNDAEIPRLQNVIIDKEEKIRELSRSFLCVQWLIALLLFLFVLVAFLLWYLLG